MCSYVCASSLQYSLHTCLSSCRPQLCTHLKGKCRIRKANSTLGMLHLSASELYEYSVVLVQLNVSIVEDGRLLIETLEHGRKTALH